MLETSNGVNWIGLWTIIRRDVERIFRVMTQTLVTPWISATLFIFIFGNVVGSRIDVIGGVPYITFVLPGILMMNIITSSFIHSSSGLYFQRFLRNIDEILVSPISYTEMVVGHVVSGVVRAVVVGLGVLAIGIIFGATQIHHFGLFLFYAISVAVIFSLIGMIVGLWANGFEQLNVLNTFAIMPLSFLGGIFYTLDMLPEKIRVVASYNPFFYFIDGIRFSMIGLSETNSVVGYIVIITSIATLGTLVVTLFRRGWRIRA